jgi:hypothetical protein
MREPWPSQPSRGLPAGREEIQELTSGGRFLAGVHYWMAFGDVPAAGYDGRRGGLGHAQAAGPVDGGAYLAGRFIWPENSKKNSPRASLLAFRRRLFQ